MDLLDKAKDLVTAASVGIALSGTLGAATPADLQAATVDNFAHMSVEKSAETTSQVLNEVNGEPTTSQPK
jgi:hypothetical protein